MSAALIFSAFIKLLIIASPASAIALLLALTPNQSVRRRGATAAVACSVAAGILLCFAIAGPLLFRFFNISMQAFKIAGGIFLLRIGLSIFVDADAEEPSGPVPAVAVPRDVAITPLGVPMICGPGMISTTMLFGSDLTSWVGTVGLCFSVILTLGSLFGMLWLSAKYSECISPFTLKLASKLTGIFVLALGFLVMAGGIGIFLGRGSAI
ncbi:MAG: NAAT family transporter [Puniceicoccales bacterium]|jgi:multiple antibiotic resistance protein|nr:NAAT family transporter [Puniceicoccales bacterium]